MQALALAVVPVFVVLIITELLWRSNTLRGESARKLVHIVVGFYVAFWPFIIGYKTIQLISVAFLLTVAVSLKFGIFRSIHGVVRRTWGEALFAVGIGLTAVLADQPWIFTACILHMSVADGFAALAGKRWGKGSRYYVVGHEKSIVGTSVFWICSLVITGFALANISGLQADASKYLLLIPLATSLIENFGIGGTDNVFVPMTVYLFLTYLS